MQHKTRSGLAGRICSPNYATHMTQTRKFSRCTLLSTDQAPMVDPRFCREYCASGIRLRKALYISLNHVSESRAETYESVFGGFMNARLLNILTSDLVTRSLVDLLSKSLVDRMLGITKERSKFPYAAIISAPFELTTQGLALPLRTRKQSHWDSNKLYILYPLNALFTRQTRT